MRNVRKLRYFLDFLYAIKKQVMGTPSRTIGRGTAAEGMLRGMLGARLREILSEILTEILREILREIVRIF